MKILGRGWQYTVYDLGNDRVLKIRNSKLTSYFQMIKNRFPLINFWKFPFYYKAGTTEAIDSLNKVRLTDLDKNIFGNPKILDNGIDYEQDKIFPLDVYLEGKSLEESFRIIDKFIEFNQLLIRNSIIDKNFSIGKNFGINQKGEIVLSDIGELRSAPENIKRQIDKKIWTRNYVLRGLPNNRLREYFVKQMNQNFK